MTSAPEPSEAEPSGAGPSETGTHPPGAPDTDPADAAPGRAGESEHRGAPSRRALATVVVILIIMVIASWVGDALGPGLVDTRPLLLIALNSRIRWLVLTVNDLNPVAYFTVGTLRALASDPLFYLLGYWYGDSAVRWMEQRTATVGQLMRSLERSFGTWGYPLVAIAPNNPICLLAGAARMRPAVFMTLNVGGTIARLVLIKLLGEAFEAPINWVLDVIRTYRLPLIVISVLAVAFSVWNETRKGTSEIEQLRHLEQDVAGDGAAGETGRATRGEP
ncbi:DedA family protein [Rhabdothermincola sp.]|uniref:DedA family protein n=1 Tax=Rhabdothermincola sp. TaxID=2820405 RepID=UPI002FE324FF